MPKDSTRFLLRRLLADVFPFLAILKIKETGKVRMGVGVGKGVGEYVAHLEEDHEAVRARRGVGWGGVGGAGRRLPARGPLRALPSD